jgi:alpha-1,3-rhamnosyl/mannosyltransferase
MTSALRVSVDARPLDIESLRAQGIGRYAHGLLGPLAEVAAQRGGELVLLRERTRAPAAFAGPTAPAEAPTRVLRRPPLPARLADWPEQVLLPLDLRRARVALHHALSIYRAAVFPGVPAVMTMHDVAPLMWPDQYLRTGVAHRMLYRAARRARLLLAVSETARRDVIAHLGVPSERVLCVPEAADERFRPSDSRPIRERLGLTDPYLLFVGGLAAHDPRKNLEGLIDAYAAWRRSQAREERLVLAGRPGPATEELRLRAERAGAPVTFTGFVADEELPALMSGATCMVTSARYEGFGLPALEAISCGTPVVAFDAGAVREVAGPGCLLAPDGDGAGLMRAVARVCDEPGLRERLGEDGRRHSRRYSWRRTAELTWDAYERAQRDSQAGGSSP